LAGCTSGIPGIGGPSEITLPALTEGWAALREADDGETHEIELILGFADELGEISGISLPKDQIAKQVAPDGITLDPQPVDLPGADDLPKSHRLEGVARREGGLSKTRVGPWTHYDVTGFTVIDQQTTVEVPNTGQTVSVTIPVDEPKYHVYSPGGYAYLFPKDDRMVSENASRFDYTVNRSWEGLFTYEGEPRDTTIPNIRHTELPGGGGMRMADEYRHKLITNIQPLYQRETYNKTVYRSIGTAISNLSKNLLEDSLESALLYEVPSWISAPMDVKGIHEDLQATHRDFQAAFEKIKLHESFTLDNTIFGHLNPDKEEAGLGFLKVAAEANYRLHNPLMMSSRSTTGVQKWARLYEQSLRKQKSELERIHGELTKARSSYGSQYTREIGNLAFESVDGMLSLIADELQTFSAL
jgi:hypothetical protein